MKHLKRFNETLENSNSELSKNPISDVISRISDDDLRQILKEYSKFLRDNDYTFDLNTMDKWRKEFNTRNMITTDELINRFLNDL